jgi:hypothetical protein
MGEAASPSPFLSWLALRQCTASMLAGYRPGLSATKILTMGIGQVSRHSPSHYVSGIGLPDISWRGRLQRADLFSGSVRSWKIAFHRVAHEYATMRDASLSTTQMNNGWSMCCVSHRRASPENSTGRRFDFT